MVSNKLSHWSIVRLFKHKRETGQRVRVENTAPAGGAEWCPHPSLQTHATNVRLVKHKRETGQTNLVLANGGGLPLSLSLSLLRLVKRERCQTQRRAWSSTSVSLVKYQRETGQTQPREWSDKPCSRGWWQPPGRAHR